MTNLTNKDRSTIRTQAIADKYTPIIAELGDQENALAMEIREHLYGPHLQAAAEFDDKHPDWLRRASSMKLNVGWFVELKFKEAQLLPHDHAAYSYRAVTVYDETLRDKIRKFADDRREIELQRERDDTAVEMMLVNFRTTKQLREGWPEGKDYWEPVIGSADKKDQLPAVKTDAVNAALGLPKETV